MPAAPRTPSASRVAIPMALAGLAFMLLAWALPVHLTSISPSLLRQAGAGSPSVATIAQDLLSSEKPGPAALAVTTATALGDPAAPAAQTALDRFDSAHPELIPWGGWDPFLDPLVRQNTAATQPATVSTPVLTFFVTATARDTLRGFLSNSRSTTVRALLQLRDVPSTGRFTPVNQAGGQTLDALILLTALLQQGDHPSPTLQRQLRAYTDQAITDQKLGGLEPVYFDLLALGRRLDWIQLTTVLGLTPDVATLSGFADQARRRPDELSLLVTLSLLDDSTSWLVSYLGRYGDDGLDDLRLAAGSGRDAVRLLLRRQVPVNRHPAPAPPAFVVFSLLQPKAALICKYLGWFIGAFLLLRALDRATLGPVIERDKTSRPHLVSGALALLLAGLFVAATEPALIKPAAIPAPKLSMAVPVLGSLSDPSTLTRQPVTFAMDTNTLLSIGLFAALQIIMYLVCLTKIRQIDRADLPPLVKLRLMENEENLFDGGLYVGIGGTATALVLQVLGVIDPNLLAAYSSNLFGISCVAFVKIRHVRPFKNKLILAGQAAITAAGLTPKSP